MAKESIVIYLDDDGQQRTAFSSDIEINVSYVRFTTNKNIITLPISRIIKIKEAKDDQ